MAEPTLHIHVWDKDQDDPTHELDATYRDHYYEQSDPDEINHLQFGVDLPNGQYLEIRVSYADLKSMVQLVEE